MHLILQAAKEDLHVLERWIMKAEFRCHVSAFMLVIRASYLWIFWNSLPPSFSLTC